MPAKVLHFRSVTTEVDSDGLQWTFGDYFQQLIKQMRKHGHLKEFPDKEDVPCQNTAEVAGIER